MRVKKGPIPIYYVIEKDLEKMIDGCDFDTKLPTEDSLMKKYGASRTPVRQALLNLERRGYLKRIPGKGTFSTRKKRIYIHYPKEFRDLNIEFAEINTRLSIKQIASEIVDIDDELANIFHTRKAQKLLKITKLLIMEEAPLAYGEDYFNIFSDDRLKELESFDMRPYKSIYAEIRGLGFELDYGEEHFRAIDLPEEIAKLLLTDFKYCFYRERTMSFENAYCFEHTRTYYVPDKYVYSLNLKKD